MIDASEVREDDETYMNPIDRLFEALEKKDPSHFAVKQYKKYKLAAGKTAKSILISCGARLAPFDIRELRELMSEDELELDKIGDRKTALFVIISDTDDTFNFVVSIMYSQLFNLLCDKADDVYGGRLPVHVRCLLDEFANIGLIPKFEKLIATIRSREISASIILQAQSQLKAIYKDHADTIVGNCDSTLFLGGKEKTTVKELSETLGKETIDLYNTSETRSNQKSFGLNYQKTGKELMSQDEITVMDGGKCIYQLRGVRPFLSDKFDITKHKNYKLLEDYDKKNLFDVEEYLTNKDKVKLKSSYKINRLNIWVYGESKMCENRKSSLIILNINGEQFILESDTELTMDKKNYIEAICETMYDESNEWYEDIYDMSPYDIAELFEKTVKDEVGITVRFIAINLEVSILED